MSVSMLIPLIVKYVTDATPNFEGAGPKSSALPAIYRYDFTADGYLINKRLISFPKRGIADGLHIDDQGRF
jgi:hypothetical protein